MKKPYTRTIIGFSGRRCVLIIIFQLYGSKAGIFEGNLFWVGHCDPQPSYWIILEEELIHYLFNIIKFLSNLSKLIPNQVAADIIL